MLTAKWFVRSIISFLVLQGVLGDDEEDFPECDSELYENQYDDHHTSGTVNSPDFNGAGYPVGSRCQFTINIPQGHRLNIHIGALDLEPSDFCSLDSLQINDTLTVKTLCGMMPPDPIFVKEGVKSVHLSFRSDKNQTRPDHMPNRRGFHIQFMTSSQLVDPCDHMKTCRNGRCYDESTKCNGHDDCGDGTDGEGCDFSELPLPTVECGEVPVGPDYVLDQPDGITGEKEVMQGTWPWQVSLLDRYTDFSYTCGGTLIKPQWILTAARCFEENPDPNYWQVYVGVHQKYQRDPYVQVRYVERIIVWSNKTDDDLFELGDNFDSNDDIALIKLNAPVQLGNHLGHHVCLPQSDREVQPGTRCYAAGWGTAKRSNYETATGFLDALKVIDLLAMSTSNCTYDPSTQICVENPGCPSACNGESGNPLVAKFGSKWYVVGIGSNRMEGSNRSAATNETIVYTKVSDKAEWIRKMVDKYS